MSAKQFAAILSAIVFLSISVLPTVAQTADSSVAGPAASAGPRLALVVGNGAYDANPLVNPPNDAEDIAAALRDGGFQVTLLKNADLTAFEAAVIAFAAGLKGADTGLFYYAGHGVQVDGMNYMIPTAPRIDDAASVKAKAVAVDTVVAKMEASGVRTALLFLDSCRDNPFPGAARSGLRGLAVVPAPKTVNSLIAYATSPGDTASDGTGRNGVFSGAVLKYIREPGLELAQLMKNVKTEVDAVTAKKQQPRVDDGMKENFFFITLDMAAAKAKLEADKAVAELAALEKQNAERELAIAAAKDAKARQDLEITQQTAKALENVKRLAAESAKAEAERAAKEAGRKAQEDAERQKQAADAAAQAAAYKKEAESRRAEYEGSVREGERMSDYTKQIIQLETALADIQLRYQELSADQEKAIQTVYLKKLQELNAWKADPWETDKEFQARIAAERAKLGSAQTAEIAAAKVKMEAERTSVDRDLRTRLVAAESALSAKRWLLRGAEVELTYGVFDREKKGWPVTLVSRQTGISYRTDLFHKMATNVDQRIAYETVDAALKAGAYSGEIEYGFVRDKGLDQGKLVITKVSVIDLTQNRPVLSESRNQIVRTVYQGDLELLKATITSAIPGLSLVGETTNIPLPVTMFLKAGTHTMIGDFIGCGRVSGKIVLPSNITEYTKSLSYTDLDLVKTTVTSVIPGLSLVTGTTNFALPTTLYLLKAGSYSVIGDFASYGRASCDIVIPSSTAEYTRSVSYADLGLALVRITSQPAGAAIAWNSRILALPAELYMKPGNYAIDAWWPDGQYFDAQVYTNITASEESLTFIGKIKPPIMSKSGISLRFVDGGSFIMGSTKGNADEQPVHTVTVSSFYLGGYEITQAEYQRVMGSSPSYFKGDGKRPVEQVSWYDALAFCNALSKLEGLNPVYTIDGKNVSWNSGGNGYRLPTEAEWEYAVRGRKLTIGYEYAGSTDINMVGWYSNNSGNQTKAVGTKVANELGIYDMAGNVWEWCWDWYGSYAGGDQINPTGASSGSGRVIRGGGWSYSADGCRSANRYFYYPSHTSYYIGFRVARSPGP